MRIHLKPPGMCKQCGGSGVRTERVRGVITRRALSWLFYVYQCEVCGALFACVSNDRWQWAPRKLTAFVLAALFLTLVATAAWLSFALLRQHSVGLF